MANLILVVDRNAERRDRFTAAIEPLLSPLDGLWTDRCASGDFCAVWACEPRAPVSALADAQGATAVWGEAICADGTRVEAASLRRRWSEVSISEVFDGFHAAAVYDRRDGLLVGVDVMGLFPLYYWSSSDVVLVGSSAELFAQHPVFRRALNPAGLVGILLTSHLVDGQTLWEGVKRLRHGALLVCRTGSPPREVARYHLPASRQYFDRPFSIHLDILDRVLERATAHHAPREHRHTLLMSGGLDSRMLGGYLARTGTDAVALTVGVRGDLELGIARRVARHLGLSHQVADTPFEQYPLYADLQAKWEHLGNGFSTIHLWGLPSLLHSLPSRVVCGYLSNVVLGGPSIHYLPADQASGLTFEAVFAHYNRAGFHPSVLAALLRRDVFDGLIEQTIDRLRELYESYSDLDSERAWSFELHHRQRFHVGSSAWRLCFGAWPVLPVIDRGVLDAVRAMPAATIVRRRAQQELVVRRFPDLAALPLDRNSYDTRPLKPGTGWPLFDCARGSLGAVARALPPSWRHERRYYYRVYDINNPGWRAVRKRAEPLRCRVDHLFETDVLSRLLPPPDAPVRCEDAIMDSSRLKLLLGLLLWCEDHL